MSRPLASSPGRILLESLLLAVCYSLFAHLGLYLAIPPGFATAIWPPSGVALAAVLWRGNRIAGGVLLGSFAANVVAMLPGSGWTGVDPGIALGIAVGATLQTVCAQLLVSRWCGGPPEFLSLRCALILTLAGGPLACLISATWGNAVLYLAGALETGAIVHSWFTWWIGDSLGVFTFTPILLVWTQATENLDNRRKWIITVPIVALFAFVATIYGANKNDVETQLQRLLENEAFALQVVMEREVDHHAMALHGARALFLASTEVTERDFEQFYNELNTKLDIRAPIGYAPRISAQELAAFVERMRAEGRTGFALRDLTAEGISSPSGERPAYQPLQFVAPPQGEDAVLGLDLLSEPMRRSAVEAALQKPGTLAAAGPVTVNEGRTAYLLALALAPAHDQDVVAGLIYLDQLFAPLKELLQLRPLLLRVRDAGSGASLIQWPPDVDSRRLADGAIQRFKLAVGDDLWLVDTQFSEGFVAATMHDRLWPVLTAGFAIIGSLALLIIATTGAQINAERMVFTRTDELQRERRFLDSLINHLPLMLYVKDAKTRQFVRVNKRGAEFLNRSESDLLGKTEGEVFGEAHESKYLESDTRAIDSNQVVEVVDEEFITEHGPHWLHTRKVPITDAEGNPLYLLGLTDDVTSGVLARRELEHSERRNALILSSVGEGIYGIDKEGLCTFINPAACNMLGYTEAEVLGKPVHEFIHSRHRDGSFYAKEECLTFSALISGKPRKESDEVYWRKDGTPLPVEYVSTPLIDKDEMIGSVVVFSDISKRQALEKLQQEHTRRVEMINEDLEEFSYIASHDIQEPLRTLSCFTEFLVEDIGRDLPSQAKLDIEYIKKASQRMHTLINDMLAYSRAGRTDITFGTVSLSQCMKRIQQDLMVLINESDAKINVRDLPDVVGDETQLTRVFVNLVQNAIKFRGDRPPRIEIDSLDDIDGYVTVRVKDNGIGIEPQYHEHVFGAFRKLHDPEQYAGSGIGLAVVKKLVERHGGTVRIESRLGEGTTVLVRLRTAHGEAVSEDTVTTSHSHLPG